MIKAWIINKWLRLRLYLQGARKLHFTYGPKANSTTKKRILLAQNDIMLAILNKQYKPAEPLNDSKGLKDI